MTEHLVSPSESVWPSWVNFLRTSVRDHNYYGLLLEERLEIIQGRLQEYDCSIIHTTSKIILSFRDEEGKMLFFLRFGASNG